MILKIEDLYTEKETCPHTRGDDPVFNIYVQLFAELVPTRVGMILPTTRHFYHCCTCPHTRGDDPYECYPNSRQDILSPHAWG